MASLPLKDQIQKIGITYESIVLILVPAAQTIVLLYKNEAQSLDMSKKTFLFFSFGVAAFNFAVHVFISFLKQKHRALILRKGTRIVSWILTIINIIENQLIDFDEEDSTIKYLMLCYSIMGFFAFVIMQLLSISGKTLKIALISCSLLYFALRISIVQVDPILAVFAGLLCLIIIRFFILTHRLKSKKNDIPNEQQSIEPMLLKLLLSSTEDGFVIIDDKKSVYYANQKSYDMLDVNYGSIIAGLENMKRFEALSHEDQLNLREEILEAATAKNEPPKSPDEKHSSFSMELALKNKSSSPRDANNLSEQAFQEDQVAQSAGRPKFKTFFPAETKISQSKLVRKNSHASQTTSKFKPPFAKQRSKQYSEKGATTLSFPKLRSFLRSLKSTQTEGSKTHIDGIGHENTHENQTTVIHIDEHNDRKTQQSPLYKPKKNNTEKNENEEKLFKDGIPENLIDFLHQLKPENVTCIDSILNSNQIMNLIATEPKTRILEDIGYLHCAESGPKIIEVRVRPLHVMQKPFLLIQLKDVLERESYLNAKHSDREKTDLLSSVTHELRTPLNCIITMLDMVEDCVTDDVREDFILPASQSAKLLLNLINDILDYSQSKAKTLKLTYSRFNFYKHLVDIVKLMQFQAKSKGLDLLLEFDENAPTEIYSEPNRIRQIIINLIGNALKFTMKGEITLKVQYTELGVYCISVIDTGVGIKPEDVKDLFRRFSKVGGTDHINQQGVGLGLSISNTLAKMLNPNGHGIRVSSAYGKGTTFSFEIQPQNSFNAPEEKPDFDLSSDEEDVRQVIDNINELKEQYNYAQTQKNKVLTKSKNSLCGRGLSLLSKIPSSAQNYSDKDMSAASIVYSPNTNTKFQFEISRKVSREYGREYNVKSNSHVVAQSGNFKAEQSFFIQKTFQTSHFSEDHLINPQSSRRMKDIYENRTLIEINAEKDRILQDIARKLNDEFEDPYLLVVDDNAFNIVALKKILEGMKIKIDSAINGDVAMQKIMERRQDEHEKNYRLILMDCNMPIKDGYQTTREIREFERENGMERVPIIAVTASSSPRDMERCFESGMDDYLTKPISFDGLKDVIIKYLSEDDIFDDVD